MPDAWRVARQSLRWLGVALLGLCGVACLLFALAFLVNMRDEELTPETRALLTPPANPYKAEDNIYVALAGLDAPIGATVTAVGEARLEDYNQRVDAYRRQPSPQLLEKLLTHEREDPRRLVFSGDSAFMESLNSSVWVAAFEHREDVDRLLADNRELHQRYLALPDLHGYYESARPGYPRPSLQWPIQVHKLSLAVVALRVRSGIRSEQEQGLTDLERDVRLWHTVLTGEGSLESSMLSAVFLQGDYLLLADMIADADVHWPVGASDGDAVVPVFALSDWNLGKSLAAEFRVMGSSLRTDVTSEDRRNDSAGWLARANERLSDHFLKLDATLNLDARETRRRMLAAADPARLFRMRNEQSMLPEGQGMWTLWLSYNPVGKVLVAIPQPILADYSLRAWDVAALQRLVRASYEIRSRRIEAAAIPAFLVQHPEWSTHPADGRPFLWDPVKGELRVQTVGHHPPGRRFSVKVWQPMAARLAPPAPPR
jgi:hypothetical protein